jgi:ABC-type transport system substrate-binding protein
MRTWASLHVAVGLLWGLFAGPAWTLAGTGATPPGAKIGGSLTYAQNMPLKSLDAVNPQTYPAGYEAVFLLYNNLVTYDEHLNIQPDLAESWTVSPDGRRWTFKLRKGVKFHDGTPCNAEAVKFNILRIQDPKTGSPNKNLWDHIQAVETPDEATVVLVTAKPFGAMLNYLAHGSGGLVSPAAVRKWGAEYPSHPVGTGPYKLQEFTPGVQAVLVRSEEYFKGRPALDSIVLKPVTEAGARIAVLETGEADVINDVPPELVKRLEAGANTKMIRVPGLRIFYLGLNHLKKPFDDPRVRQALNYAIDKEAIVKSLFQGYAQVLDAPAATGLAGYTGKRYPFDQAKAKQLLAESGFKPGPGGILQKDGVPFKFTINTAEGEYPKDIQVVEAIQNQFRQIGVDVSIWKVEAAGRWSYLRLPPADAKYEAWLFGFNPSNGDVGYHLNALFKSNPDPAKAPYIWNSAWYKNAEVDKLLAQGDESTDRRKRLESYVKAEQIIWDEAPVVWLYAVDLLVGARKNVQGVTVWPTIFTILREAQKQ